MMNKYKYVVVGCITVFFMTYVVIKRLLNVAKIKLLFPNIVTFFILMWTYDVCFILFCFIIFDLYKIYKLKANLKTSTRFIQWFSDWLRKNYDDPLNSFHTELLNFLERRFNFNFLWYIDWILVKLTSDIQNNNSFFISSNYKKTMKNKYFYMYLLLKITPRIFVLIVFCLEVFYSIKLEYFYIVAPLLILPLIYRYLVYEINRRCITNTEVLNFKFEVIDITYKHIPGLFTISLEEYFKRSILYVLTEAKNPYKDFAITYQYFTSRTEEQNKKGKINSAETVAKTMPYILHYSKTHTILWIFNEFENKFGLYVNLFIRSCYFCAWTFIAFKLTGIYNFDNINVEYTMKTEEPFSGCTLH